MTVLTLLASTAIFAADCEALPVGDVLWSSPKTRWLIVGEDHGTMEEPEAFAEIVCGASSSRKVIVGVEQPVSEQAAIDTFLSSDGRAAARDAFLKSAIWQTTFKDGRSSRAQFDLFERLRVMYSHGRIAGVIAFQPVADIASPAGYEIAMAAELRRAARPDHLVVALVGNVHAMRTKVSFSKPAYMPAAGLLPRQHTVSVALRGEGGEQWACTSMTDCGVISTPSPAQRTPSSIRIEPAKASPYSAILYLGKPTSASPPQLGS